MRLHAFLLLTLFTCRAAEFDDEPSVTRHQLTMNGAVLRYTARAGFLSLRDETREVRGRIFYVAYALYQPSGAKPRPVTFAWNGGPGAPASLLHLAGLGPKRVKLRHEYNTPPPPYQLTELGHLKWHRGQTCWVK